MNVAIRKPMTVEAFLEWEARQERKWEFDGWQPVAMAGGTDTHAAIQANIIYALLTRLRGQKCRVRGPDMKVRVAERIRYPDAFVVCAPVERDATVVSEPVIVFEVLSESTEKTDRFEKNRDYEATPSVQRYVMFEQDLMAATVFRREGGDWVARMLYEAATLDMPEIGVSVPLAEFYADVDFPAPEPAAPGA